MQLEDYLYKLYNWSFRTFGHKQKLSSVTDHIREELLEVEATDGKDAEEWADIIMMAFDGMHRHAKCTPEQATDMLWKKLRICMERKWPDPSTVPEGMPMKHIKE